MSFRSLICQIEISEARFNNNLIKDTAENYEWKFSLEVLLPLITLTVIEI